MRLCKKPITLILLSFLFLALFATLPFIGIKEAQATTILSEGFENWNVNAWTNTTSTGELIEISDVDPYTGTYHLNATCDGSSGTETSYISKTLTEQSVITVFFDMKIKDNVPDNNHRFMPLYLDATGGYYGGLALDKTGGGAMRWTLYYRSGEASAESAWVSDYALDTWTNVRVYNVISDSAGICRLYVNGSLRINVEGLDNDNRGNINKLSVGDCSSTATISHHILIDDVLVTDTLYADDPHLITTWFNATRAGNTTQFSAEWYSTVGLDKAWFETNNSGTMTNSSLITIAGTTDTALYNVTLNATVGAIIKSRWHGNNTSSEVCASAWFTIITTVAPLSWLHTEDQYIKDSSGNTVMLKGFNTRDFCDVATNGTWASIGGSESMSASWAVMEPRIKHYFDNMKLMNANVIRTHFAVEYWLANTTGYIAHMKDMAQWLQDREMYFIIDFYNVNASSAPDWLPYKPYCRPEGESLMPNQQTWINFMVDLAKNMTIYPNVIFDMWNEPNSYLDSWLGTSTTLGGAEKAMFHMRNYTDNVLLIMFDASCLPTGKTSGYTLDKWIPRVVFNQSTSVVFQTHMYRDGYESTRWGHTYENVLYDLADANVTTTATNGKPVLIGEIAGNWNTGNDTEEYMFINNAFTIFDANSIGYLYFAWQAYGVYAIFNSTQGGDANVGWHPDFRNDPKMVYGLINHMNEHPFTWSVGNETKHAEQYVYSNNTIWASTWGSNQLEITYASKAEIRVYWNISATYPVNSSLKIIASNSSGYNALDFYNYATNLIEIWGTGGTFTIGYGLTGSNSNPQYGSVTINQWYAGETTVFNCSWTDDNGLNFGILSHNSSGSWANRSALSLSGLSDTFSDSFTLNDTVGLVIGYRFYANDTVYNSWNLTDIAVLTTLSHNPQYGSVTIDNYVVSKTTVFSCGWTDVKANLHFGILSHNSSGSWANRSALSLSGLSDTFSDSFTLNDTVGLVIGYRFYANDTVNNWNTTIIYILTTTSGSGSTQGLGQSGNLIMRFIVYVANEPMKGVTVRIYESAYDTYVCSATTETDGSIDVYLPSGEYHYIASYEGATVEGDFFHIESQTTKIRFDSGRLPLTVDAKLLFLMVVLFAVICGAGFGIMKASKIR